jgi:hypothetical protein
VRGFSPFSTYSIGGIAILVVWAYRTLVLAERRAGHVITLLGGLFGTLIFVVHTRGARINEIAKAGSGWFFSWTLRIRNPSRRSRARVRLMNLVRVPTKASRVASRPRMCRDTSELR